MTDSPIEVKKLAIHRLVMMVRAGERDKVRNTLIRVGLSSGLAKTQEAAEVEADLLLNIITTGEFPEVN
jgi:hypothetical protein